MPLLLRTVLIVTDIAADAAVLTAGAAVLTAGVAVCAAGVAVVADVAVRTVDCWCWLLVLVAGVGC